MTTRLLATSRSVNPGSSDLGQAMHRQISQQRITPPEVAAGAVLIRQGDAGDAYYAIAAGELDVFQDGKFLRRCGRGDGVGEIALLHNAPRSASIIARTRATVYELKREPFLTAVLGHAPTRLQASRIALAEAAAGSRSCGVIPKSRDLPSDDVAWGYRW